MAFIVDASKGIRLKITSDQYIKRLSEPQRVRTLNYRVAGVSLKAFIHIP